MRLCAPCDKLCSNRTRRIWPQLIAVFLATFIASLTWLAMDSAGVQSDQRIWWSAAAFLVSVVSILAYMANCIRRYCERDRHLF